MFELLDLSSRALPQLKDICKQFGIDAKGLTKPDMVLKIAEAQATNATLAAQLVSQFPKKDTSKTEVSKAEITEEKKPKKPRITKPLANSDIQKEAKPLFAKSEPELLFQPEEPKYEIKKEIVESPIQHSNNDEIKQEPVRKVPVHNHPPRNQQNQQSTPKPQHQPKTNNPQYQQNQANPEAGEIKQVINNDFAINIEAEEKPQTPDGMEMHDAKENEHKQQQNQQPKPERVYYNFDGIAIGEANKQKAVTEAVTEAVIEAVTEAVKETTLTAIKGFINKTRLGDAVIADTLDVSVELVKTIREEIKAEKRAETPKKTRKTKIEKP